MFARRIRVGASPFQCAVPRSTGIPAPREGVLLSEKKTFLQSIPYYNLYAKLYCTLGQALKYMYYYKNLQKLQYID